MSDDQLQPDDTLDDKYDEPGHEDVLDGGYDPPDRPRGSMAWGVTAWEESQEETLEQRIKQEVPDPDSAYGAPDNESGLDDEEMVGGDDPDAIRAEDDFVGDGDREVGRLVAPDQGDGEDDEKDEVADDVGFDGGVASPEESAMHLASDQPSDLEADFGTDDDAEETEGLTEATAYRIENWGPHAQPGEDPMNELDSLEE